MQDIHSQKDDEIAIQKRGTSAVGTGWYLVQDGSRTIWNTLNALWTDHEIALLDLKKATEEAEAVAKKSL